MRKAVILAGGKGTRLAPYTTVFPKPLVPLDDTPILEVVLRQLSRAGFDEVTLAVGHLAGLIEAYFGDGLRFGLRLRYSREAESRGTAGPIALVGGLEEPFLVMNGDVLTTLDYGAFLDSHTASGAEATISTFARTDTVDFGVIETDGLGVVIGYREKPQTEYLVSMGVYAFSPPVLALIQRDEYLDVPDLILRLLADGRTVRSALFHGYWLDIGRHDDFALAQQEFAEHREDYLGE
jgi:NDP-sugar pyrophosphorylase family protein